MSLIGDGLREFMESNQYPYTDVGDDCYRLRFTGSNGDYRVFAKPIEEPGQIRVFTYCPVKVPGDRRSMVAEYINRVNYSSILGRLEMDFEDGEVRARSTGPVDPDSQPPAYVLRSLFESSSYLIDNWMPGLLRVAFGSDDPSTAYATTLDGLRREQNEPSPSYEDQFSDADDAARQELTAIEHEVSRLLADQDWELDSPADRPDEPHGSGA